MNTSTGVLPPPEHFYSFGCGFCGAGERKYRNIDVAIRAGHKHVCRSKQITIYRHVFYSGFKNPVTTIFKAAN
jgi:hypothetical protein